MFSISVYKIQYNLTPSLILLPEGIRTLTHVQTVHGYKGMFAAAIDSQTAIQRGPNKDTVGGLAPYASLI